jgi:hypothetical protein
MSRSTNHQWGVAEPEVWFRIVHMALHDRNGPPMATYREQAVEIALGPKGVFENGNSGALTRRVSGDGVVSAVPPLRGNPKPPKDPKTPRVVELLRKAIEWQRQLDAGEVQNKAEIARREGITRARVIQIMGLLRLAPQIQNHIHHSVPETVSRPPITERALRPIEAIADHCHQVVEFEKLLV